MANVPTMDGPVEAWIDALLARHLRDLTRAEFLKAVRALSARYVERRAELPSRSPLDSAGKRAAFAAFYAPLHFLTVRQILQALRMDVSPPAHVVDLGCGTGVAGAAWAAASPSHASVHGVDLSAWALDEARWNYRTLGLTGRASRGDFVTQIETLAAPRGTGRVRVDRDTGLVLGWSLNELPPRDRERAIAALLAVADRGARVLVIEPIARRLFPWCDEWASRAVAAGGRADEWRFTTPLPRALAELDDASGFAREGLTARSVAMNPC